jgi:hypothetical protein
MYVSLSLFLYQTTSYAEPIVLGRRKTSELRKWSAHDLEENS